MKKIYTLISVLAISVAANAQRPVGTATSVAPHQQSQSMVPTDTITSGLDWNSATPTLYGVAAANGGGSLVGANGYGDKQKVQVYDPQTPVVVYGAIYWFGSLSATTSTGSVKFRVYSIDGLAISTSTPDPTNGPADTPCPSTPRVSDDVLLTNIDTSGYEIYNFSAPQFCAGAFGVGFDVENVNMAAGDSLGLVTSANGEISPTATGDYNFEQWSDNSWYSIAAAWTSNSQPLLIDLAIFPIIEQGTGIESPMVNGVSLGVSGANPFLNTTTVNYTLQNNATNVDIVILNANGQVVSNEKRGTQAAGSYNYEVGSNLAAGTYFVMLNADGRHLAVKMVKQ